MGRPQKPWTANSVGKVIGREHKAVNNYLDGVTYPEPQAIKRIEQHYGWPARAQIRLIPEEGADPRYGEAFREVLDRHYRV